MKKKIVSDFRARAVLILVEIFSDGLFYTGINRTAKLLDVQPKTIKRYISNHISKGKFQKINLTLIDPIGIPIKASTMKLLNTVPDKHIAFKVLRESGHTHEEIGKIFGIEDKSVKRMIRRYKQKTKNNSST